MKLGLERTLLRLALALLVAGTAFGQRPIERVAPQKAQRSSLLRLAEQLSVKFQMERALAESLARRDHLPIRRTDSAGVTIELQRYVNCLPLYHRTQNLNAAKTVSTNVVWPGGSYAYSLDGGGVMIGEWDAGSARATHQEYTGRVTTAEGASNTHSTHVGGTLIAAGINPAAHGMAAAATLYSKDWNNDGSEMATAAAAGLELSNHSYGFITGWTYNYFSDGKWVWFGDPTIDSLNDYRFGFYDENAQYWDDIERLAPNYLIFKAAGNDRLEGPTGAVEHWANINCTWALSTTLRNQDGGPSGYNCLEGYGVAKNVMTVGAVYPITGGYTKPSDVVQASFSSCGPTDDGRIKPDVVGDGINLFSTFDASDSAYGTMSGTSMATPNVCGSAALLIQYQQRLHPGNPFLASTLKGLIIHTADEAGPAPGPDYTFGWGLMDTRKAVQLMSLDSAEGLRSHIDELVLHQGDTLRLLVGCRATEPLKATICWTDIPGTPPMPSLNPPDRMLVNDVDLRILRNSDDTVYYPWVLDPTQPSSPATTGDNNRDNVEQVLVPTPVPGNYTILVTHKGVLTGDSQYVSLITSGNAPYPVQVYSVTASAGPNGSITPSGTLSAASGTNQQFIVTPLTGYHTDSLIVDGVKVDSTTSYTFMNITANHTIRVTFKINSYSITATAGSYGTISPSGTVNVNFGSKQQFTITPNTGYHVDSVIVDGARVDSTTSYTFRNISGNHTIRAVFTNVYSITASADPYGTISPSGTVNVNYGANQQFMIMSTYYHTDSVIVDGVKVDSTTSYTFMNITANHTIRVTFKINSYSITATAGPNGTISPSGTVNVNFGSKQQFTITPNTGYHVDSVIVNGARVDSTTSYTFRGISGNHTIRAVFTNVYSITASAGPYGTISPSGTVNVNYGSNQQFIITPNDWYQVDTVIVDGSRVDSSSSYTFINVAATHTIRVGFKIGTYTRQYSVSDRWNLVSVPLAVSDYSKSSLYPTAVSSAFAYQNGYVIRTTLSNGAGYWLKFNGGQSVGITGLARTRDSISVQAGWNIIGSISSPVAVAGIGSSPGGIVASQFFGYSFGYHVTDTIQPGKGYWVKVNQSGKLILASAGELVPEARIRIVPDGENPPAPPGEEVSNLTSGTPNRFALQQNYPNPFNPSTVINFELPKAEYVRLVVYDMLGREVATLVNGAQDAGYKSVEFSAANLPSGIYFYRLRAGTFTETKKLLLLR